MDNETFDGLVENRESHAIYNINREHKSVLLAQKIAIAMKANGLTRQSFANLMGVQASIITRWLSGKHNFTVETLFDIEEQLNLKIFSIEPLIQNSMSFHLLVNSSKTVFTDTKDFPGFFPLNESSPHLIEKASEGFYYPAADLNEYMSKLIIDRNEHVE